ncbi:TetR/AcrR family transcriptional regulator [Actinocorallia populi]|uniref:TetR/AcrR family transcriptional regulator n=1 Tax=Actinocorallia populi TaxID=2079200 RepID=UPI000D095750|nr:TetR/AcrR family transcriptional regulator [Actinocorallia populi]
MARTQRADLRRRADALLDAAATLLVGAGLRELRIEDVARRAGVGKGTVYLHWSSREHLLLAVGAREAAAILETVVTAIRADPAEIALHRYLRRHFLEAMRRPVLKALFITDHADFNPFARQPVQAGSPKPKLIAAHDHLAALHDHRLLRPGQEPADIDFAAQAIAYGFFSAAPLVADDPRFSLEHQADRLAEVVRRSFEPAKPPAPERYAAAAPQVIDAFERLGDEYRRIAYGTADRRSASRSERPAP